MFRISDNSRNSHSTARPLFTLHRPEHRTRARWGRCGLCLFALVFLLIGCTPGRFNQGSDGWSPPAAIDGAVYVGTKQGEIKALIDGGFDGFTVQWTFPSGGDSNESIEGVYNTPLVSNNLVYASGIDGVIYAIDRATGQLRWKQPRGLAEEERPSLVAGPALDTRSNTVFVGSEDGKLYAYDADNGDERWSFRTGDKIWSTPVVKDGVVYFGSHDKNVYAVSVDDGEELWHFATGGVVAGRPLLFKDLVIVGSFDKKLYALEAKTGFKRWEFEGKNWFWAGAVADIRTIFAPSMDGNVYALDSVGNLLWKHNVSKGSAIVSAPVVLTKGLVVAAENGRIVLLNTSPADMGPQRVISSLSLRDTEIRAPLSATGESVFVGAQDSTVRRIQMKASQVQMWCFHTEENGPCETP